MRSHLLRRLARLVAFALVLCVSFLGARAVLDSRDGDTVARHAAVSGECDVTCLMTEAYGCSTTGLAPGVTPRGAIVYREDAASGRATVEVTTFAEGWAIYTGGDRDGHAQLVAVCRDAPAADEDPAFVPRMATR